MAAGSSPDEIAAALTLGPDTLAFILYRGDVEQRPFEMSRVLGVVKDGVRFVADGRWIGAGTKTVNNTAGHSTLGVRGEASC